MTWPPSIIRVRVVRHGRTECGILVPLVLLLPALIILPIVLLPVLLIVLIGCRGRRECVGGSWRLALGMFWHSRGTVLQWAGADRQVLLALK